MTFSEVPFSQEIGKLSQALLDSLKLILASITTTWGVDHLEDGTHRYVRERSRSTPLGEWISPAYDPSMFTGGSGVTWTVAATDVETFQYTLIGNTMIFQFWIDTTTIAGAGGNRAFITLPGGFLAGGHQAANLCQLIDGGTTTTGIVFVAPDGGERDKIQIGRLDNGNFTNGSDNFSIRGVLMAEVTQG